MAKDIYSINIFSNYSFAFLYFKIIFMGHKLIYLLIPFISILSSCHKENTNDIQGDINPENNKIQILFEVDKETNLKNPYMGWSLYSEGTYGIERAESYWTSQDEAGKRYAGVYYLRWPWSYLESEEGKYAWDYDENFKSLIQGALDRGLRLAFRIFVDSRDCEDEAVPEYVFKEGNYFTEYNKRAPYPNDRYFLEKYTKFIEALGKKFNDPSIVDYIDCAGIGKWGEEHTFKLEKDGVSRYEMYQTISNAYAKAFDKVINVINFTEREPKEENLLMNELEFSPRRDGYVSKYFPVSQQESFVSHFPSKILIAEACYWGGSYNIWEQENGKWKSWKDYYTELVDLALDTHANYLDMRTPTETSRLLQTNRDDVKRFISKGGYRIYPKRITANIHDNKISIEHTWQNVGVGVLPNNNKNLRFKYKVAFALFNDKDELVQQWNSEKVEVSELVGNKTIKGEETFDLDSHPEGTYKIGVGIINTLPNDSKDIKLAIKRPKIIKNEWVYIGDVEYK